MEKGLRGLGGFATYSQQVAEMNEERIIPAFTRHVVNVKEFTDPMVSKQTKNTGHYALPTGCTPQGGNVREQMAATEGNICLQGYKMSPPPPPPPHEQSYSNENAKNLWHRTKGGERVWCAQFPVDYMEK